MIIIVFQICNIFVGLGLPWLLYNCIKNKSVPVDTSKYGKAHVVWVYTSSALCVDMCIEPCTGMCMWDRHVRVPEHDTLRIAAMFQFSVVAIFALLILGNYLLGRQSKHFSYSSLVDLSILVVTAWSI